MFRGRALIKLRRMKEAQAEIDRLTASPLMTFDPSLWQEVAQFQVDTGQVEAGRATLLRYLREENPKWGGGWDLLAEAEDRLGNPEAAESARQNAHRVLKNQALTMLLESRRARWNGRTQDAEVMEQAAALIDPDAHRAGVPPGVAAPASTSR